MQLQVVAQSSTRSSKGRLTVLRSLLIGTSTLVNLRFGNSFVPKANVFLHPSTPFPGSHQGLASRQLLVAQSWALLTTRDDDVSMTDTTPPPPDVLVAETSLRLKRVSWLSWWCQVILTVTSSVILVFAKNVVSGVRDAQVNFVLAGTGIVASFMSIFWTWGGGARLSRRLLRRPTSRIQAANMLRKAIKVGVSLNLIGMFLTLLGAEQTVGVLAIKTLTARPWNSPTGMPMMATMVDGLQPLDILVVQANTNSLFSHFVSLVCLLYLNRYVDKLDPPSEEDNKPSRR
jgi:Protein of unknown function (DUF3611)